MTDTKPTSQEERLRSILLYFDKERAITAVNFINGHITREQADEQLEASLTNAEAAITTHHTPKTEQHPRIKYRCPSCTRQELILTDGWLICGNLECKAPDTIDKLLDHSEGQQLHSLQNVESKIHQTIVEAFLEGRRHHNDGIDYPASFKTLEIMQLVKQYDKENPDAK